MSTYSRKNCATTDSKTGDCDELARWNMEYAGRRRQHLIIAERLAKAANGQRQAMGGGYRDNIPFQYPTNRFHSDGGSGSTI
jgi:hypothetical protein